MQQTSAAGPIDLSGVAAGARAEEPKSSCDPPTHFKVDLVQTFYTFCFLSIPIRRDGGLILPFLGARSSDG